MRRLVLLLFAVGCAGSRPPAPVSPDLRAPALLAASGSDSVIDDSTATVRPVLLTTSHRLTFISTPTQVLEGAVKVRFVILSSGVPDTSSVHIVAAPDPKLGQAAVDWILGARFQPALLTGRRVAVRELYTVAFN